MVIAAEGVKSTDAAFLIGGTGCAVKLGDLVGLALNSKPNRDGVHDEDDELAADPLNCGCSSILITCGTVGLTGGL